MTEDYKLALDGQPLYPVVAISPDALYAIMLWLTMLDEVDSSDGGESGEQRT
jgi:hypothetical protein